MLDYCRLSDITIQAWSSFQYSAFAGPYLDNPPFPELNQKLQEIADLYQASKTTIAIA